MQSPNQKDKSEHGRPSPFRQWCISFLFQIPPISEYFSNFLLVS